jgi:hypothetical protein
MVRRVSLLLCAAAGCIGSVNDVSGTGGSASAGGGQLATGGGAAGGAAAGGGSGTGGGSGQGGGAQGGGATGGGDAGTPDAGTPDAGVPDAGFRCSGQFVCDDFEGTNEPKAPLQAQTSSGSVTVDQTRAYSGTHSVKFSIDPTTPSDTYRHAMLHVTGMALTSSLVNNSVYGRFMIWTPRIPDGTVHWTFAHGDGPAMSGTNATYNLGGMGGLMANYYRDTSPAADCWQTKDVPFPSSRWVCVAFFYDGVNNEIRFWMDGAEVPELHVYGNQKTAMTCTNSNVDGKWYAPQFQNIAIGWESYQHDVDGGHDAWIDDIVLDSSPIPCP